MQKPLWFIGLLTLVLALHLSAVGQSFVGRVEGSRPGETFRKGESAPSPEQESAADQSKNQNSNQSPVADQSADDRQSPRTYSRFLPAGTPVIMEFSDLQCPDSARFNSGLKNTLLQRYVSSGRASYEWHDFPLPSHNQAVDAAAAARCAGQRAESVRQRIMSNQGQMTENMYASYARSAGVDPDEFSACMRNRVQVRAVQKDQQLGQSYGVRGTPTLVLAIADGQGNARPLKLVKAYDPPQQVIGEIDSFLASAAVAESQPRQRVAPATTNAAPAPIYNR